MIRHPTLEYQLRRFWVVLLSTGLLRGEQFDSDLSLYYLRARYYNEATGRFLSKDPEPGSINDPATLHRYLYARHDPVNRIDPTGQSDSFEEGEITEEISIAQETTTELKQISDDVNCILNTTLDVLSFLDSPDFISGVSVTADLISCQGRKKPSQQVAFRIPGIPRSTMRVGAYKIQSSTKTVTLMDTWISKGTG